MNETSQAASIGDFFQQGRSWVDTHVLSWNFLMELALIAAAFAAAWFLAKQFTGRLEAWVLANTDEDDPWVRRLGRTADMLIMPAIWVGYLWLLNVAMKGLGQPHDVMRIVASLLNAWIVVHVISSVVVNRFWRKSFATLAWTVAALNVLNILEPTVALLDGIRFTVGDADLSIYKVIKGIVLAGALLWLAFALSGLLTRKIQTVSDLTPSVQTLISKIARIALLVTAVLVALGTAGVNLTALTVFGGALGIGVGFGLQKVVSNFVSGIILLLDRSIRPNDVIEVGGTYGHVKALGARYTSVITRDGTEFLIPNENLITEQVVNWSYTSTNIRRRVPIGVSYNSDVELAREQILEAAAETERILRWPEPKCHLKNFGDNAVDLEARFWLADPQNGVANVQSDFLRAVWRRFKEHGIEIPYPQRDLNLKGDQTLEVMIKPAPAPAPKRRPRKRAAKKTGKTATRTAKTS